MFEYNYNPNTKELFIELPSKLNFDYMFLLRMTEFMKRSNECDKLRVSCKENAEYDKLSKAYLFNISRHYSKSKDAKWNRYLFNIISSTIHTTDGKRFSSIDDIARVVCDDNLIFYRFKGDIGIERPIAEITKLLVDKNVILNAAEMKEFLSTTIGEIFSNSINHSEQDEVYFMYDIMYEDSEFYLCVNILDYGTTIIDNVKSFIKKTKGIIYSSMDCLKWAIGSGNTTRSGSGGYGLPTLISYIKAVNGKLHIFSGDAYYSLHDHQEDIGEIVDGYFTGTSVTFKVKLYETSQVIRYDASKDELISISLDNI